MNPVVTLACGGSTADNVSYLVQASTTSLTTPCKYKVCPLNNNICRIRYDFTVSLLFLFLVWKSSCYIFLCFNFQSFVIGAQNAGTAADAAAALVAPDYIGACQIDTFTILTPGAIGPPIICGTNTGYHSKITNQQCSVQTCVTKSGIFNLHFSDNGCS